MPNRNTQERLNMRRRKYAITPELLMQLFTVGNVSAVLQGIPPGARIIGVYNDYNFGPDHLSLVVQHVSFEECSPGEMLADNEIVMESRADFESLAQCTYEFTAEGEDSAPVYVCTVPSNFTMDRIDGLRRIFEGAEIEGRVFVMPADVTLERIS